METVESLLGNSLWVMLSPSKQVEIMKEAATIPATHKGYRNLRSIQSIDEEKDFGNAYRNDVGSNTYYWHWDTFPHPSSWPKEHDTPKAFLGLSYDEDKRNYQLTKVYLPRMIEVDGARTMLYTQVPLWCLLVFSNLSLNFGGGSEDGDSQVRNVVDPMVRQVNRFLATVEGDSRFQAASRKATGLLKEIDLVAKRQRRTVR